MTDFGTALRLARERRGLTRDAAAAQLGVSPRSVTRWEHAVHEPHPVLASLARVRIREWLDEADAQRSGQ